MNVDLNAASNFIGPLDGTLRIRLNALIENPCEATWDDAHSIVLNAGPGTGFGLTLWQAVLAVDPTFPQSGPRTAWVEDDSELGGHSEPISGWERVPTADVIRQAINYATR